MSTGIKILIVVVILLLVGVGIYFVIKNKPVSGSKSAAQIAIESAPASEISVFQNWANKNKGLSLRTDGVLDDTTKQAALKYFEEFS